MSMIRPAAEESLKSIQNPNQSRKCHTHSYLRIQGPQLWRKLISPLATRTHTSYIVISYPLPTNQSLPPRKDARKRRSVLSSTPTLRSKSSQARNTNLSPSKSDLSRPSCQVGSASSATSRAIPLKICQSYRLTRPRSHRQDAILWSANK